MRLVAILLVALLAAPASAQSVTLPEEIRGAVGAWIIVAPTAVDGGKPRWRIDPELQEVPLDLLLPADVLAQLRGKVVTALKPGRFRVEAWNAKGDAASDIATCWLIITGPAPPPEPPGPGPGPPPQPPTPPNPTPAGPRTVLIFRESAQDTPAQARAYTALQSNQSLRGKGHDCFVFDVDAQDADGRPAKVVENWRPHFKELKLPAIIIADKTSGQILYKAALPDDFTAQTVLELLARYESAARTQLDRYLTEARP